MKRGRKPPFFVWNEKVRLLFVNKKEQKTWLIWAVLVSPARVPLNAKFLRRYFQQAAALLPSLAPTGKTSYTNAK
jgi:hypothetical protein